MRLIPIIVIVMMACGGDYHRGYLEDLLEVHLPEGSTNVEHFTGSDIAFTSHYSIPEDSLPGFARMAGFSQEPPGRWNELIFVEELSVPWNSIPGEGDFMYLAGSSGWNSWDVLLNMETGDMWATVYYTDPSGDPPGE